MAKLIDHQLFGQNDEMPKSNRDVVDVAIEYNKKTHGAKIKIFKAFQKVEYTLDKKQSSEIVAKARGVKIPSKVIDIIIQREYCVVENNLFFFDAEAIKELKLVLKSASKNEIIKTLQLVPEARGLAKKELNALVKENDGNAEPDQSIITTVQLYPYQKEGVSWLCSQYSKRQGGILADDMGLGKTLQIIAFIVSCFRSGFAKRVLIVVPNSLIANWILEISKFTKGIRPYVHWGSNRLGFIKELEKHNLIITTYSTTANDLNFLQRLFFDIMVLDEASLIKNPDSQRTKAVTQLNFGVAIAMTGTPFENSMLDLWSVTNVVSPLFLGKRADFHDAFVINGINTLTEQEITSIEEKVRPIMLRRMKEDVLSELPPKLEIHKPITMTPEERRGYGVIEDQIKDNIQNKHSAFSLISHLRKYSSHPLLFEGGLKAATLEEMIEKSSKFSFLESTIRKINARKQKALVFANHIAVLDKFVDVFASELNIPTSKLDGTVPPEERQKVIDVFSRSDGTALLFLNPVTAGMGLNITSANHVFHYSRQWNPALEEQATSRAYRNGQKNSVNVYYLYYADTIEETISDRIKVKNKVASNLIKATLDNFKEEEYIFELIREGLN